jgi:mycoredoxin
MHDTRDESAEPDLIMYCTQWCPDCRRAREWLDSHNISYREVDVSRDVEARERAANHNEGRLHTPTFELGDGVCVDFRPDRLSEILGLGGE